MRGTHARSPPPPPPPPPHRAARSANAPQSSYVQFCRQKKRQENWEQEGHMQYSHIWNLHLLVCSLTDTAATPASTARPWVASAGRAAAVGARPSRLHEATNIIQHHGNREPEQRMQSTLRRAGNAGFPMKSAVSTASQPGNASRDFHTAGARLPDHQGNRGAAAPPASVLSPHPDTGFP